MYKKIFLVLILLSLAYTSQAQLLKKIGRAVGRVVAGVAVGIADQIVERTGDQKTIDGWNDIKSNSNLPDYSYSYDAGQKMSKGDWVGAAISAGSEIAENVGVSSDLVALGNSGITNWINGDKQAAVIDVVQIGTHAAGAYELDYYLESQRNINNINREYRDNLKNGMTKEQADKIRIDGIANTTADMWMYIENIAEEKKARAQARRMEARDALIQRGYSQTEADYLSAYMSIEALNEDDNAWSSADEMLDYHNISTRNANDNSFFFDEGLTDLPPVDGENDNPPAVVTEPEPEIPVVPEDPLKEVKEQLEQISVSGYGLNGIELLDDQKVELDKAADILSAHKELRIKLSGNSCDIGSDYGKERVAMQRAQKAKEYLISKGIEDNRIEVESKADTENLNENASEKERKMNRRVYISINE